jgi:integrase
VAQLVDRSVPGEARWQVRWKPNRSAPGRSQTFVSAPVTRGKPHALRDAERLKSYVDAHGNLCSVEDALVALGYVDVVVNHDDEITVRQWADLWVESRAGITSRTKHDYRVALDRHILPALGDVAIARLSRSDIESWATTLQPLMAPKTLLNLQGLLSTMLDAATRETPPLRADNPARGIRLRRGGTRDEEMCFLSHAEWAVLHRSLERKSTVGRQLDETLGQDLGLLLVGSGLRYSEATALEVKHIDLMASVCTVRVAQAWKRQPDSSYRLDEPKTRRSRRTVTVSEEVRDILISRCAGKSPDELVFATTTGRQLKNARFANYYWRPAVERAQAVGLEKSPRIHDLRHTHAAWLIAAGRPLPSIQRRLGHESITTTVDTYGHLLIEVDSGDIAALSAALTFDVNDLAPTTT